ncbi:MAG: hypothetical protein V4568_14315 [Pseudomonadota bacterium]
MSTNEQDDAYASSHYSGRDSFVSNDVEAQQPWQGELLRRATSLYKNKHNGEVEVNDARSLIEALDLMQTELSLEETRIKKRLAPLLHLQELTASQNANDISPLQARRYELAEYSLDLKDLMAIEPRSDDQKYWRKQIIRGFGDLGLVQDASLNSPETIIWSQSEKIENAKEMMHYEIKMLANGYQQELKALPVGPVPSEKAQLLNNMIEHIQDGSSDRTQWQMHIESLDDVMRAIAFVSSHLLETRHRTILQKHYGGEPYEEDWQAQRTHLKNEKFRVIDSMATLERSRQAIFEILSGCHSRIYAYTPPLPDHRPERNSSDIEEDVESILTRRRRYLENLKRAVDSYLPTDATLQLSMNALEEFDRDLDASDINSGYHALNKDEVNEINSRKQQVKALQDDLYLAIYDDDGTNTKAVSSDGTSEYDRIGILASEGDQLYLSGAIQKELEKLEPHHVRDEILNGVMSRSDEERLVIWRKKVKQAKRTELLQDNKKLSAIEFSTTLIQDASRLTGQYGSRNLPHLAQQWKRIEQQARLEAKWHTASIIEREKHLSPLSPEGQQAASLRHIDDIQNRLIAKQPELQTAKLHASVLREVDNWQRNIEFLESHGNLYPNVANEMNFIRREIERRINEQKLQAVRDSESSRSPLRGTSSSHRSGPIAAASISSDQQLPQKQRSRNEDEIVSRENSITHATPLGPKQEFSSSSPEKALDFGDVVRADEQVGISTGVGVPDEIDKTLLELENDLTNATIRLYLQTEGLLPKQSFPLETFRENLNRVTTVKGDPFFGADELLKDMETRYDNLKKGTPDIVNEFQEILLDLKGLRRKRFGKLVSDSGETEERKRNAVLYCLKKNVLDGLFKELGHTHNPKHFFQMRDVWTATLSEPFDTPHLHNLGATDEDIKEIIETIKAIPGEELNVKAASRYIEFLGKELQARGVELTADHLPDIALSENEIEVMATRMGSLPSERVSELVEDLPRQAAERFVSNFQNMFTALKTKVDPKQKITGEHLLCFDELGALAVSVITDPIDRRNFLATVDKWIKRPVEGTLHESLDDYRSHQTVLWRFREKAADSTVLHETAFESFKMPTHQISRASTLPLNVRSDFPPIQSNVSQTKTQNSKKIGLTRKTLRKVFFVDALTNRNKKQSSSKQDSSQVATVQQPEQAVQTMPKEVLDLSVLTLAHQFGLAESTALMKAAIRSAGYDGPRFGYIEGSHHLQKGWVAAISSQDRTGAKSDLRTEVGFHAVLQVIQVIKDAPKTPALSHDQIGEFLTTLSLYQDKLRLNLSAAIEAVKNEPITRVTAEDETLIEQLTGNRNLKPRPVKLGESLGGPLDQCPIVDMKERALTTDNPTFWFHKQTPGNTTDIRSKEKEGTTHEIIAITAGQIKEAVPGKNLNNIIGKYRTKQQAQGPVGIMRSTIKEFTYNGPQNTLDRQPSVGQSSKRKGGLK